MSKNIDKEEVPKVVPNKKFPLTIAESIGVFSILSFCAASGWLSGIESSVAIFFSIFLYGLFFYFIRITYCRILGKEYPKAVDFAKAFVTKAGIAVLAASFCVGTFVVYQNEIDPAKLPVYTFSNGKKTVKFRAMAHIAAPAFYDGVKKELETARKNGYVLFYEGVRPGTPENTKKLDAFLGVGFSESLYDALSTLYGLVPQDTGAIASPFGKDDRNVDVSVDEIVKAIEARAQGTAAKSSSGILASSGAALSGALAATGSLAGIGSGTVTNAVSTTGTSALVSTLSGTPMEIESSKSVDEKVPDILPAEEILRYAASLKPREIAFLRYFNRAVLSYFIKNREIGNLAISGFANPDVFPVILAGRDRVLVDEILASEHDKMFVTYGLLHFDGVFELLQEKDAKWKMSAPPEYLYPTRP